MTTFGDRVYELGGTPVGIGIGGIPILGKIWYVDGTNGSDNYPGFKPGEAKKTIQAALTAQIAAAAASTGAYGDVIYVMPGTYTESITGNMTKVQIVGVGRTGVRPMARIHPTATAAYTGEMLDSGFDNLEILGPSAPTARNAAIVITASTTTLLAFANSFIDNCLIAAGTGWTTYNSIGINIGALAAANTTYEFADHGRIANTTIGSVGGRLKQPEYGICMGAYNTTQAGAEYKGMTDCDIVNNRISAGRVGIKISCGAAGCTGSTIRGNTIGSQQNADGCQDYGIQFNSASADQLCCVVDNRVVSSGTAISNGSTTGYIMGNIVASNGTLTYQLPTVAAS